MSESKMYTRTELRAELEAIIQEMPDNINPVDSTAETCLYTAVNNPDRHCIVGQLAVRLGWNVPSSEYEGSASTAAGIFDWPISQDGREFLDRVQSMADAPDLTIQKRRSWGQIDLSVPEIAMADEY
jgi:hypothetical protein